MFSITDLIENLFYMWGYTVASAYNWLYCKTIPLTTYWKR